MATDDSKVGVSITGAIYKGASGATAPTSQSSATTGYTELGWIGEDGITEKPASVGDAKTIIGWQNGAVVRTVRGASTDNPTYKFKMLETNKTAIETAYGITVTQTVTEGSYEIDTTDARPVNRYILDSVDGSDLERVFIPKGVVISLSEVKRANGEVTGFEVEIEAQRDSTLGYNAKVWNTRLKS